MKPYYEADGIRLFHGDCREVLPAAPLAGVVMLATDPPYPNNAEHFDADVAGAREVLAGLKVTAALVFWSELERPPVPLPLVAVHIWHRTNVNGRPYESLYHFASDGRKRRSEIKGHAAVFKGVGPGCREYAGHPTQKPLALMAWALNRGGGPAVTVLDPFAGVGSTLVAAKLSGRRAVGVERDERYCEAAARRLEQGVFSWGGDRA